MDPQLINRAMTELNARQSASSSPTPGTPAGPTASGRTTTGPSPERKAAITALVSQVFTRLEALFPRTFSSAFPSADLLKLSRRELAQELAQWPALPPRAVVERAMSELKRSGSTWPPTIPVLVSMLAPTPEDVGMPALAEAWREVLAHAHEPSRHRWSHEAVRLAGAAVGWWELTHTTAQSRWPRLEKRFASEYQALVNRVMAGEELVPRQLLEHDSSRTPAELAERASRDAAAQQAEAAGLPHRMNADQGLRSLRAALGRTAS
jgi:hypothetical protein